MNKFLSNSVQCLVHVWVALILLSEEFIFVWKSKLEHQRHYQAMGSKPKDQFDLEHYLYFLNKIQLLIDCAKFRQSVWNWMERMRRRCQAKTNNTSNVVRLPQVAIFKEGLGSHLLCQKNQRFQERLRLKSFVDGAADC